MDAKQRDEIVRSHGPHISHKRISATTLNRINIKHLVFPNKSPSKVHFKDTPSSNEDSGPPSPQSGQMPNFGVVATGIYRSAFPFAPNLEHLKSLRLKTMITLVSTHFDMPTLDFLKDSGIRHYRVAVPAHKNGKTIDMEDLAQIMRILTNPCNHPVLVHCNKGKHRTGCIVAAFRKLAAHNDRTDWSPPSDVVSEYLTYSAPKSRDSDITFINTFSPPTLMHALADLTVPIKPFASSHHTVAPPTIATLTPPPSKPVSRTSPVAEEIFRPWGRDYDDEDLDCGIGGICTIPDGTCPFQVEHERVAMKIGWN